MKRKPMRRVAPRSVSYRAELESLRPLIEARSHAMCEAKFDGCRIRPVTLHHRLRRSQGGKNTLTNVVGVCPPCHERIHANPAQSYEDGWLIRRTSSPGVQIAVSDTPPQSPLDGDLLGTFTK